MIKVKTMRRGEERRGEDRTGQDRTGQDRRGPPVALRHNCLSSSKISQKYWS